MIQCFYGSQKQLRRNDRAKKKVVEKVKIVFTGGAWSSNDQRGFYYKIEITKENARRLVKLMDTYKALHLMTTELDLHELVAWDDSRVEIFSNEEMTDEQLCDVCKVRVQSNGLLWELKDKYNSDVYETMDVMRNEIEAIANEED